MKESFSFRPRTLAEEVRDTTNRVLGSSLVADIEQLVRLRAQLAATPGSTPSERRARARELRRARKACLGFLRAVDGARFLISGRCVRPRDITGPRPKLGRGSVPFGSRRRNGKLIPHEDERQVIERITLWRAARGLTFAAIAKRLEAENVPSPGGVGTWSPATVQRILRREAPPLSHGRETEARLARVCRLSTSGLSGYPGRIAPLQNRKGAPQQEGPAPA